MSRLAGARPPLPATPEDLLFRGYGTVKPGQSGVFRVTDHRDEPCACGGTLSVSGVDVVERVVEAHNASPVHAAWSAWRALRDAE